MPDVLIRLTSRSGRPVRDEPELVTVVKKSHYVHPRDIETAKGLVLINVVPGRYTLRIAVGGYRALIKGFRAKAHTPLRLSWPLRPRAEQIPTFTQLSADQRKLFESYRGGGASSWNGLSDNQAATFFQISYVLSEVQGLERPLSHYIGNVQEIGGATIERFHDGKLESAVGWRMHVLFKRWYRDRILRVLLDAGFDKDRGLVHPTHTRFGYTESYRQDISSPTLQFVLRQTSLDSYSGSDIDLDKGVFHKSAPHDIYKRLVKRYPEIKGIYKVK